MAEFYQPYLQGVNTKVTDELKKNEELKEAYNASVDKIGSIKKRYGYSQVGDTLTTGNDVLGLSEFYPSTNSKYLIAVCNNSADTAAVIKYRTVQNYNFTITTLTGSQDYNFEFAPFIDYLFGVKYNPTTGTVGSMFSIDNTMTYSATANVTNAPKGKYICALHAYLLVANGTDESSNAANSRVWWPDPPTTIPYSLTWDNAENWWDFQPFDGDEITGIIATSANRALVFKNYSIHAFEPVAETSVRISSEIGCVAPRSLKNCGNYTIFLGHNGIYATTGSEPILISNAVQDFVDGINWDNVLTFCAGVEKDRFYHLFIGDLTSPETLTNVELVWDSSQNQWTVNYLYNAVKVYCNYVQEANTTSTSTSSSTSSSSTSSSSYSMTIV